MTARMFRLTQIHQRIDERLAFLARKQRPNRLELLHLSQLKQRAKDALRRLSRRELPA